MQTWDPRNLPPTPQFTRNILQNHHPQLPTPSIPTPHFPPSAVCNSGKSRPTRLAVNRIRSCSSRFMPGLYRSSKVAYVRWARAYWANCTASWIRIARSSSEEGMEKASGVAGDVAGDAVAVDDDGVVDSVVDGGCSWERKTARSRWCSGVGVEKCLRGSSRSRAR